MPETLWTVVLSAGAGGEQAMERLCQLYLAPILAYLKSWNFNEHDARDLSQMFIVHFLCQRGLARVDRNRGRFRFFLLTCLKNYVADHAHLLAPTAAQPLDTVMPDAQDPPDTRPRPDQDFDRKFALTLIEQTLTELRADYAQRGQSDRFDLLHDFLPGRHSHLSHAAAGQRLGLSETAVTKAVSDLRERFRRLFRHQVAQTVGSYEEVDQEITHHIQLLSR